MVHAWLHARESGCYLCVCDEQWCVAACEPIIEKTGQTRLAKPAGRSEEHERTHGTVDKQEQNEVWKGTSAYHEFMIL